MRTVGIFALAVTLVCGSAVAQYKLSNGIAAIANEAVITHQDVVQASEEVISLYRRTFFNNPEAFEQKRIAAMSDALEQLIDRQLVLHDFRTIGGIIQESWIDDTIKERVREQFGDRATLTKTLQSQGITYETYRQRERDRIVSMMMERKNVGEALLISPAKIERHYETNLHRFKLGDQIKLRMIRLSRSSGASVEDVRQLASEIKVKIDGGVPFSEMASVHSEYWSKEGGLWGWKEESQLKKGLSEIAFSLNPGECSQVISLATVGDAGYWIYDYSNAGKTLIARRFTERNGAEPETFVEEKRFKNLLDHTELPAPPLDFYLMFVEEKRAARTRSLQEVRDEIEKDLLLQERARLQRKWIERLRAKALIRYF
jgi:peptidyl-prolyl cis-trans isomerase SurA